MEEKVSFTTVVKEEITTKPFTEERLRSLLSSFIRINGRLHFTSEGETLELTTENAKIAKFIYGIIQQLYGINVKFSYLKSMRFNKKTAYTLTILNHANDLLDDLQISFLDGKISKAIAYNDDTVGGYLSGAFLASGSVNSPYTSNYHLEISVNNENFAKWLSKMINKYNEGIFNSKIITRRNNYIVYLKKSDLIADFLSLIGATNSCLEFEGVRVDRDFANINNRLENCDQANIAKQVAAAEQQIKDIKKIDKAIGIKNIKNPKQRELCKIRLANEDLSMQELADKLSKKLGVEVTKSNVAHIFRKLHEMAGNNND